MRTGARGQAGQTARDGVRTDAGGGVDRRGVCEWAGWHDRERGQHETARGDGTSWNGHWVDRLGRRISMNRSGEVLT